MFCFDCLNICKFIKSSFTCKVIVEYLSHVIFYKLNVNLNCNIDASANKNYHLEVLVVNSRALYAFDSCFITYCMLLILVYFQLLSM
ncbi:hypothetical protein MtrunA17_Chr6g0449811 [Medicago truncatula]|uniref:Transmembrane protein n=1 Tax=Medicago truncatula TaxID=3880 RepID=A0A396H8Y1_MEDTR|nr:hypothetical protein MtrunA17_Chr6g0449811 [Medicago truncatula]